MHPSAYQSGKDFFQTYANSFSSNPTVVEVGSQNVNGSIRDHIVTTNYIGLDIQEGPGVDIVLKDFYKFSLDTNSADMVVTSSCFEHCEMFWLTFLESLRVLKPNGLLYINAPSMISNQPHTTDGVHRYPQDCWRFYPDCGHALVKWAQLMDFNSVLLESYIDPANLWGDFVGVFLKDKSYYQQHTKRILDSKVGVLENFKQ